MTVVKVDNHVGEESMHDLTVADIHTYYVLAGTEPVLIHNCDVGESGGAKAIHRSCDHVCLGVSNFPPGLPRKSVGTRLIVGSGKAVKQSAVGHCGWTV
ncbi:hypothetical protein [Phytohabitans houttuyneae]|uniref:hypothetical protein n=1 Tax=Phytohabitans houttuyneae TaxID=1076126 RepID=UPI001FE2F590|nr:hypothetical protein [Phytohabitans houttuyneae]